MADLTPWQRMASHAITCEEIESGALDNHLDALLRAAQQWDVSPVRRAIQARRAVLDAPAPIVTVPDNG